LYCVVYIQIRNDRPDALLYDSTLSMPKMAPRWCRPWLLQ
jgi:hypothetical protein